MLDNPSQCATLRSLGEHGKNLLLGCFNLIKKEIGIISCSSYNEF
jgi:hypothetical protein